MDGEKLNSAATNLAYLPKGKAATCDVAKRFDSVVALKLDETMDFSRSDASPDGFGGSCERNSHNRR